MKFKYILYVVVTLGILLLGYFLFFHEGEKKEEGKQKGGNRTVNVEGIIIETQKNIDKLTLSGTIDADEKIDVRSEVSGIVQQIYFAEGARVVKGQTLVKINDIELQAQLKQAKTRNQLTSENERRARLLLEKGAISQEEYDIASADYKTAQSQIQLIQAQIAKTSIKAPFSGVIGLRNISPGAFISPETLITTLVKSNAVKITFSIPEKYSNEVKIGSKIQFKVANDPTVHQATIYALQPEIEINTRTLLVRAKADNADGKLIPGTFASIEFGLNEIEDAIMVPSEAIVPVQDGKKVFILKNGKAKEVMVETGSRNESSVMILSGLNPKDTLLTTGVLSLKEGAQVKVKLISNSNS